MICRSLASLVASLALIAVSNGANAQSCPTPMLPPGTGLEESGGQGNGPFFANKAQADAYYDAKTWSTWTALFVEPLGWKICSLVLDAQYDGPTQWARKITTAQPLWNNEEQRYDAATCTKPTNPQALSTQLNVTPVCPTGYKRTTGVYNGSTTTICQKQNAAIAKCPDEKNEDMNRGKCPGGGDGSSFAGNPCNIATGNKFQTELDYQSGGVLQFRRYYNSSSTTPTASMGKLWRGEYDSRLVFPSLMTSSNTGYYNYGDPRVYAHRADGRVVWFTFNSTAVTPVHAGTKEVLTRIDAETWELLTPDGARETYKLRGNAAQTGSYGRLEKIVYLGGESLTIAYSAPERISTVKDDFGKTLTFTYASGRVSTIADPSGNKFTYQYNAQGYMTAALEPDSTPTNLNDNPRRQYTYHSSLAGALLSIIDESGATYAEWTYDSSRRATSSKHAGGADQVTFTYNGDGTTTVQTALGASSVYSFEIAQSAPRTNGIALGSASESRVFDTSGYLLGVTDRKGAAASFVRDDRGFETSRTEGIGSTAQRVINTTRHAVFGIPTEIEEAGRTTTLVHDSKGNVLTRTVTDTNASPGVARTWTFTYNGFGRMLTADGPRTDVTDLTTYTYYTCTTGAQCGQVNTATNALGHTTTYNTYNVHGQPTRITTANGLVTSLAYDLRQRLTDRCVGGTLPGCTGGELTHLDYWPAGLLKRATNPDGSYVDYIYDNAHRLTEIKDGALNRIVYTLDAMGNRTAENTYNSSNALRRTHSRVYNTLNQLWKDVNAAGTSSVTTVFAYDDNGNHTSTNAPLSRNSTRVYDELNRLKQVTDPMSGTMQLAYDDSSNLTSVTDPRNLVTSYTYTGFGDLETQTSPDTGLRTHSYDSGGNLDVSTDARGAVTDYSYDVNNRVASMSFTLSGVTDQTINYAYDAGLNQKGLLTSAWDADHSMAWAYDSHGRVTGKGQTVGTTTLAIGYGYDSAGRIGNVTLPSGSQVTFGYNANGQVTSATLNGSTTILSGITYDPFGPITGWTWGNGVLASRGFDSDGKVTQVDNANGASLSNYGYDDAFRITSITDAGNNALSWTYGYDALDRLNSAVSLSVTDGWTYDANGNRLTQSGTTPNTFSNDASSNRLNSVAGSLTRTYSYDNAGNTLSFAGATFSYNNRGRMVTASNGGITATYMYNALGQRARRTTSGVNTLYLYDDAGHLAGEYTSSGTLIQETIWLGDLPIATLRPNGSGGVNLYYVHADHLNTPRLVTDTSNNIRWRWDSDAFGSTMPNTNPTGLGVFEFNLRFPGQQYDSVVGLHYNYFRDYDGGVGRYVQSDPLGLQGGLNTFVYAVNSPKFFFDVNGLAPGDLFATVDDAVRDLMQYAPGLQPRFVEHGGWIYEVGNCYSYNVSPMGDAEMLPWENMASNIPRSPRATWHTHPFRPPVVPKDNQLSTDPEGDLAFAESLGLPSYLIKHTGGAVGYDPLSNRDLTPKQGAPKSCDCK